MTSIHHINKGLFVVCPQQNPDTITTNIESSVDAVVGAKKGVSAAQDTPLSHYNLPILSFPVKPVYLSTLPLWPVQFY